MPLKSYQPLTLWMQYAEIVFCGVLILLLLLYKEGAFIVMVGTLPSPLTLMPSHKY